MKKIMSFIVLLLSLIVLSSCNKKNDDYDIITTLFPHYDIASNIVGDKMSVNLLTNPGVEAHDFSPSSKQMGKIKTSKLFLFTSYEIDIWLNENEKNIVGENTVILDMSKGYDEELDHDHEDDDHNEHDHDHAHVHYWTDPFVMLELTDYVLEQIIKIDSNNEDFYRNNALIYKNSILNVHNKIELFLSDYDNITLYFAGHNALHGFEHRYDINIVALSNTSKPDADITSKQILTLVDEIKLNKINYLYTEELSDLKVPLAIRKELEKDNHPLTLLELHAYHNLNKNDFKNNVTYYELLERNYENIKKGLLNYEHIES